MTTRPQPLFGPDLEALDAHYRYRERYPIASSIPVHIDTSGFPDALVARARRGWTEAAVNEGTTLLAFETLLAEMRRASTPERFRARVSQFCREEALHVELCVRVAQAFGGLEPRRVHTPRWLEQATETDVAFVRAMRHVVRICCVGEAFSLPMLAAVRDVASLPVVRAVLDQIVEDEAPHGSFGFAVLDWAAPLLGPDAKHELAGVAAETIASFSPLWKSLTSTERDGITSEGYRVADVNAVGFLESTAYRTRALRAVEAEVIAPLAARGIEVRLPHA